MPSLAAKPSASDTGPAIVADEARLRAQDPEIWQTLSDELARQRGQLEMIASENFTSPAVMAAVASVLTNKYAEGYPGKRYYGGCEVVDVTETLAIERAKKLFNCQFANVQPHSGSSANMEAYAALISPGDTIMGQDLSHGGHLTHGSPVNFSGSLYKVVSYQLDPQTQRLNFDLIRKAALEHKPKMIIAGASAYARLIDFAEFRKIADEIGAFLVADIAHVAGLVVTGLHPHPFPHCHIVTTTTHKTLRGPRGGLILTNDEAIAKKINSKVFPGNQGGPLMHVIAGKAVAFREALQPEFAVYAKQIISNCQALARVLLTRGIALVSGGTDNHLLLIDLSSREVTGKDVEDALGEAGITVNKNTVPYEKRSPFVTSGVRVGTAALTTRGMKEPEMEQIAGWISDVIGNPKDTARIQKIRAAVADLSARFPLYRS
ncbi:MAG: serine hydroxymethyltransferase [Deltaproteobacteria bacterium]|nr:serine hydroxymethyltransferase [Deltaproteobacteria bacterium]